MHIYNFIFCIIAQYYFLDFSVHFVLAWDLGAHSAGFVSLEMTLLSAHTWVSSLPCFLVLCDTPAQSIYLCRVKISVELKLGSDSTVSVATKLMMFLE
jgi:hypothetical protein